MSRYRLLSKPLDDNVVDGNAGAHRDQTARHLIDRRHHAGQRPSRPIRHDHQACRSLRSTLAVRRVRSSFQDWPGLLRFATGCGGRSGWSPKVVIAASTVPAAGSKPCGSPIRSTRQTASPGTTAQAMRARAQQTETLCSAEKPSVPKKSRPRRSRISPRQPIRCPSVYSVSVSALDASMSPRALMTATDDLSRRLANRAVRPCHGWERKPPSGSTDAEVVMGHRVRVGDRCIPGSTTPAWAAQGCRTTAVRGADGAFMVIPDVRLSPVCSA
jgi:hypothetical protein